MTKPFNEHLLWKSKTPPPSRNHSKSPMILPKINSLTGIPCKCPNIWDEITNDYKEYSMGYWDAVDVRKDRYRRLFKQ